MTVSSNVNKVIYTGNGVVQNFPITFNFNDKPNYIGVYVTDLSNVTVKLTTGYTVNLIEHKVSLSSPLSNGYRITIIREIEQLQEVDLANQGPFQAETIEAMNDKLMMIAQDLSEKVNRCVRYSVDQNPTDTETTSFLENITSARDASFAARDAALISETNAAASETSAAASAASALTSKNAAATSATNAATSAASALTSKNAAATSEANALSYANSAAGAATSEANAAASAASALSSKNAAATSATNAATSAAQAAVYATTVEVLALKSTGQTYADKILVTDGLGNMVLKFLWELMGLDVKHFGQITTTISSSSFTQLVASTSAEIKRMDFSDTYGSAIGIYKGAPGSEVQIGLVSIGGGSLEFRNSIPSGSRISIKSLTTDLSGNEFNFHLLG